ncbi:MAG: hypothetical protein IPK74_08320 [Deltaproteobacteria bacterium]|nr:hypothetical protein [Deltaproteobacteria bacterium]
MKKNQEKVKLLELNIESLRAISGGTAAPGGPKPLPSSCNSGCLSMSHGPRPVTCVPCSDL